MPKPLLIVMSAAAGAGLYTLSPLEPQVTKGLVIFLVIALLWLTEAVHLTVTAIAVPVLAVVFGVQDVTRAFANFAHPIIFLFFGGFALATALRHRQMDMWMASRLLHLAQGRFLLSCVLLFSITALLSMWVSNTAVTAMMLPLALGLLADVDYSERPRVYWFLLLGIAYSASIGGMGSLVGSPPNAITGAALGISFVDWMRIGLPLVIVLLPLMLFLLYWLVRPGAFTGLTHHEHAVEMDQGKWRVLAIFLFTVALWLASEPLSNELGIESYLDAVVAMIAVLALILTGTVDWDRIQRGTDWGVLMLFGGGLALGGVLKVTGASQFLAESVGGLLQGMPYFGFLILLVGFVIFLTELTSNTASAALLVPLFMSIAQTLDLPQREVALAIGLSASCAFMLPVATPPNAIVYGSGWVPQRQMMRIGVVLNFVAIAVIGIYFNLTHLNKLG